MQTNHKRRQNATGSCDKQRKTGCGNRQRKTGCWTSTNGHSTWRWTHRKSVSAAGWTGAPSSPGPTTGYSCAYSKYSGTNGCVDASIQENHFATDSTLLSQPPHNARNASRHDNLGKTSSVRESWALRPFSSSYSLARQEGTLGSHATPHTLPAPRLMHPTPFCSKADTCLNTLCRTKAGMDPTLSGSKASSHPTLAGLTDSAFAMHESGRKLRGRH